jgi:hypothetical protein
MNVRLTDYDTAYSASTSRANVTVHQRSSTAPDKSQTSEPSPVDERAVALSTYFELLENFAGELDSRFGDLQSNIASAVSATNPGSATFMDKAALKPLADLANVTLDDCELEFAKRFFMNKTEYSQTTAIAKSPVIETMPGAIA